MTSPPDPRRPSGPVQAFLFDLDGTLIDSKRLYLEAYRRALEPRLGRPLTKDDIIALRPTAELRFLERLALEAGADVETCLADFRAAYEAAHETHFDGIQPGVTEALEALRARGIRLGLVTGKSRRSWSITSRRVQLPPFDVRVFDDDVAAPKPDPEGLLRAVEVLRLRPASAAYVGDAAGDLEAARAAGLRPVAALWARRNPARRAELAALAATFQGAATVATPAELLGLAGP